MIVLKDAHGNELIVNSDEQASVWENYGYTREGKKPAKKAAAKKAPSDSDNSK